MIHFHAADVAIPLKQRRLVKEWLIGVVIARGYQLKWLNYIFCSDEYLLQINREYLSHDFYTDIITFPISERMDGLEGECYISIDRVRENAKENGATFAEEMRRVMAHGVLHLMGENDKDLAEAKRMRKAEDDALNSWAFHVERHA